MDQLIWKNLKSVAITEANVKNEQIEVEKWLLKYIFGRKGENIKHLTQDLKVQVNILDDRIELQGKPEEINITKKKLIELIEELRKQLAYEEIKINSLFHSHIIGKNGTNVNKLKQDPLTLISIPRDGDVIHIEGKTEDVAQVKKALLEMIYDMEIEVTVDLIIEQRFHHNFIGAEMEKLQDIREKFNQVKIHFPEPCLKSDKVLISGPKRDVESCCEYLQALNEEMKLKNFILDVPIYKRNYKFIVGKGEENIKKIRDETNVGIDLPMEGLESDVITISGQKENVLAAKCKILAIQESLDNLITQEVTIPARFHDSIIGKKAENINSIAKNCGGVIIKFPTGGTENNKVSIHGPKEDVLKAKNILLEISQEKQLTSYTAEVKVDPKYHKDLIGKNGINIQKVEDKTGAAIVFPRGKNENSDDVIRIFGRKEEVEAAKRELEGVIADLKNICEEKILIDPKYHCHFYGRHSEVLKQISDEFENVSVSFPRKDSNSYEVRLKGHTESIDRVKTKILEIVRDLDSIITECEIPQEYHSTLWDTNGSNIQRIEEDFEVAIRFPNYRKRQDSNSHNIITIKGKKENCDKARQALMDLVPTTEVVGIPYDFHKFIIGKKGYNVTCMREFYNVDIIIPHQSNHSDFITIKGAAANVEKTKVAIKERVEQLKLEKEKLLKSVKLSFEVDPQHHPKIIGRNGTRITKIREQNDVQIKIPDQNTNSRVITVTGYKKNAEAAKEAILKLIQDEEFNEFDNLEIARIRSKQHIDNIEEEEEGKELEQNVELKDVMEEEEYPEFDDEEEEEEYPEFDYEEEEEEYPWFEEEEHPDFDDDEKEESQKKEYEEIIDEKKELVICNKTQLTISTIVIKCSCIRIGSYKISPEQHARKIDVTLTEKGIKFIVPSLQDGKKYIEINLRDSDTTEMWIHFGKCLPVIFAYTSKQFGESVQSQLNLIEGNTVLFDPTSDDMKRNKVTFVIDSLSEEHQTFMRQAFPGPEKLKEIDKKEANEIFLKSTPMIRKEENDNVNYLSEEDKIMIRSLTEAKLKDFKNIFLQANKLKNI